MGRGYRVMIRPALTCESALPGQKRPGRMRFVNVSTGALTGFQDRLDGKHIDIQYLSQKRRLLLTVNSHVNSTMSYFVRAISWERLDAARPDIVPLLELSRSASFPPPNKMPWRSSSVAPLSQ
jgi:hypothetical protein